jgi:muramoyltetrapeptide carboxypeptidase
MPSLRHPPLRVREWVAAAPVRKHLEPRPASSAAPGLSEVGSRPRGGPSGPLGDRAQAATLVVAAVVFAASFASVVAADDRPWLAAPALRPGDTVALVAPCGIPDPKHVDAFAASLEAVGFRVDRHESLTDRRHRYLAGTDDERADELNRAIRDPSIRGVFVVRGGFGLTRIVDRLDYEALRRDPKVIVGYSDVTGLHVAVARKCRLITFHAPMAGRVTATGADPSFADRSFRDMLLVTPTAPRRTIPVPDGTRVTTVTGGRCEGRLMGGNLSLICATLGTPYAIDATDAVLFIEDINERPYRVDRMLAHLRLAGVLDDVAGVVVGRFTCDEYEGEKKLADERQQREVVLEYCRALGCPVVADFPCGHVRDNATLPLGARVALDADAGTLDVLEPSCSSR